ncbi:MAG: glycosyltransferase [Candidatus Eisenbacteria bacterium]|uniref:Glycosyltransferase n=1 Tax=Eiseniibacteriota bacterium TaxID=2212470 RepID=A0A538T154_UNCEI|nr:MAG: glycosyltransferase [Candidatus Eisenbacteria bacterium]
MWSFTTPIPPVLGDCLLAVYLVVWVIFAVYGLHRIHLIRLFRRRDRAARPPADPESWPSVTVQLPVYNERYVVHRLIEAAGAIDYPRDRLEIQVLDDSTDLSREIAAHKVAELRALGTDVVHLTRDDRQGFKAGALQRGLERAKGEFLAIFDADFVPPRSILREMVPYFSDPAVGMVQSRWQHLNQDYSILAQAQAISLDGHFVIEHAARMSGRRFFNFNGTAGVLRKACVVDAGGWQSDTLTEDLDLSYRAQLRGWRFVFAPHVLCPSELPVEMNAFKAQQHRWVKGSIQVARKLLPIVWRSRVTLGVKVEASFHLTYNVAYVFLLLLSLIVYPVVLARYRTGSTPYTIADSILFLIATSSVIFYFGYAQRESRPDWKRQLRYLPFVMSLGMGLSVTNTRAVLEALVGHKSPFHRTPKFRIERRGDPWRGKRYRSPLDGWALLEIALGLYFVWTMLSLAHAKVYAPLPFFLLYLFGFLYVGVLSLVHARARS